MTLRASVPFLLAGVATISSYSVPQAAQNVGPHFASKPTGESSWSARAKIFTQSVNTLRF